MKRLWNVESVTHAARNPSKTLNLPIHRSSLSASQRKEKELRAHSVNFFYSVHLISEGSAVVSHSQAAAVGAGRGDHLPPRCVLRAACCRTERQDDLLLRTVRRRPTSLLSEPSHCRHGNVVCVTEEASGTAALTS